MTVLLRFYAPPSTFPQPPYVSMSQTCPHPRTFPPPEGNALFLNHVFLRFPPLFVSIHRPCQTPISRGQEGGGALIATLTERLQTSSILFPSPFSFSFPNQCFDRMRFNETLLLLQPCVCVQRSTAVWHDTEVCLSDRNHVFCA